GAKPVWSSCGPGMVMSPACSPRWSFRPWLKLAIVGLFLNSGHRASDPRHRRPDLRELALKRLPARQLRDFFLVLRQTQADDIDAAAAEAARHQHDGIQRKFRALLRRAVEMDVEI